MCSLNFFSCYVCNYTLLYQANTAYRVTITAANGAGLTQSAETSPVVFDNSLPQAGRVTEGTDFTDDLVWWGYTDFVKGMLRF